MTQYGNVPLRTYSAGGITNTPQMALFGEGSVPEAYVPVPSGRIPVEMRMPMPSNSNGGAPNINVTVHGSPGQDPEAVAQAVVEQAIPQILAMAGHQSAAQVAGLADRVNRGGKMAERFGRR